jgi:hypothetical protein
MAHAAAVNDLTVTRGRTSKQEYERFWAVARETNVASEVASRELFKHTQEHGQGDLTTRRDDGARPLRLGCSIPFAISRTLLARAFASQGSFRSLLLAGLQIERVPLDVLDDIFRHDFSLKTLERALQALAFVKLNFCQRTHLGFQSVSTPQRNSFPLRAVRLTDPLRSPSATLSRGPSEKPVQGADPGRSGATCLSDAPGGGMGTGGAVNRGLSSQHLQGHKSNRCRRGLNRASTQVGAPVLSAAIGLVANLCTRPRLAFR